VKPVQVPKNRSGNGSVGRWECFWWCQYMLRGEGVASQAIYAQGEGCR